MMARRFKAPEVEARQAVDLVTEAAKLKEGAAKLGIRLSDAEAKEQVEDWARRYGLIATTAAEAADELIEFAALKGITREELARRALQWQSDMAPIKVTVLEAARSVVKGVQAIGELRREIDEFRQRSGLPRATDGTVFAEEAKAAYRRADQLGRELRARQTVELQEARAAAGAPLTIAQAVEAVRQAPLQTYREIVAFHEGQRQAAEARDEADRKERVGAARAYQDKMAAIGVDVSVSDALDHVRLEAARPAPAPAAVDLSEAGRPDRVLAALQFQEAQAKLGIQITVADAVAHVWQKAGPAAAAPAPARRGRAITPARVQRTGLGYETF